MASAPLAVQKWLKAHGDAHELRISGLGPYATGPIEVFLRSVRGALKGSQGRITNLPRLDIRLGLMAAFSNRKADEATLTAALPGLLEGQRFDYRELDSAPFDPMWILATFP